MWAWVSKKIGAVSGFVILGLMLLSAWKRNGKDEAKLEGEKEKSKEQEKRHEKAIEIVKTVEDVRGKNAIAPDSTIISRLRNKWQRD